MRSSFEEAWSLLNKAANSRSLIRVCAVEGNCIFLVGGYIHELTTQALDVRGAESRFAFFGLEKASFEYSEPRELPPEIRDLPNVDFTLRIIEEPTKEPIKKPKKYFFLTVLKSESC